MEEYSFSEFCSALGKSPRYIRPLQIALGLHIPGRKDTYPENYLSFMRKVVSMRAFNVPIDDIKELLKKEVKILQMLHLDTVSDCPTWFMGNSDWQRQSRTHLLLTGIDLGFDFVEGEVQWNLNFRERTPELFHGHEMGEDIHHVIELYLKLLKKIDDRVRNERRVLLDALAWA
ncbi:MAG: hypothetical protein GWM98_14645, partial [Nitrospinaceae bacterium]|nr:hypothetical protein [Nitrospinaceae bacterium]